MNKNRAWQRMLSGRRLDLLDPTPLDIEVEDIAHGLSFVARWNGQTNGDFPYSVAEHSLLVEQIYSKSFKNPEKKMVLGGTSSRCTRICNWGYDFTSKISYW